MNSQRGDGNVEKRKTSRSEIVYHEGRRPSHLSIPLERFIDFIRRAVSSVLGLCMHIFLESPTLTSLGWFYIRTYIVVVLCIIGGQDIRHSFSRHCFLPHRLIYFYGFGRDTYIYFLTGVAWILRMIEILGHT